VITIALDAMGGDHGPQVVVPAGLDALALYPQLQIIFVGDESAITPFLKEGNSDSSRYSIRHTTEQVLMDESPATAMRTKKNSSMRVAINLVQEGSALACVSAGNTGALMAIARFVLKTLPGIDRPAIIYSLPTIMTPTGPGSVRVLDLGANVDCTAEHLFQFAVMGSVCSSALDEKANPRVGLLNIGSEVIKGSEVVKKADQLLRETSALNYIGFIEGNTMYYGDADVVVCDGFVGNVALKSSEGVAKILLDAIKKELMSTFYTKILGWLLKPAFARVKSNYDPRNHNGASLLGLNGVVIKSHGNADRRAFVYAIKEAMRLGQENVPGRIRDQISQIFLRKVQNDVQ
jgi:phosphate acyltransferase